MKITFSEVLDQFDVLSQLANTESDRIHEAVLGEDQPLDAFSPKAIELISEPSPCEAAMGAYLAALPDGYLFALTALLYSGRDKEADPVDYWKDLKKSIGGRDRAIEALMEKHPRMEYIKSALERMPTSIDVNALPTQINSV